MAVIGWSSSEIIFFSVAVDRQSSDPVQWPVV